ncbi:MAG: TIGR00730 family Rossman fold protein [Gemmataceae bacterium]
MSMRQLAVFCGSQKGGRPEYAAAAQQLGALLARRDIGLVFGAGHIGLMGVLADAVLRGGGTAIGVIPQALVDKELAHNGLTELRVVATMHERKALMAELADAFVALPGGFGTGDEWFEILTWAQLGLHHKPIGLLNIRGFFDPLLGWIDHALAEGFIKPKHRQLIRVAQTPEHLLAVLAHGPITPPQPKWIDESDL